MGDRTNLTVEVSGHWPNVKAVDKLRDKLAKKLERWLPGHGLETYDYDGQQSVIGAEGLTGFTLGWNEMSCGFTDYFREDMAKIAKWLDKHAPTWTEFRVWEDPRYEWLGQVVVRTRDGRQFSGDCDASGRLQISEDAIAAALTENPNLTVAELAAKLTLPAEAPTVQQPSKVYYGERYRSVRQVESFTLFATTPEEIARLDDLFYRADDEDVITELSNLIDQTEFEITGTTDADEEDIAIYLDSTKENA